MLQFAPDAAPDAELLGEDLGERPRDGSGRGVVRSADQVQAEDPPSLETALQFPERLPSHQVGRRRLALEHVEDHEVVTRREPP